MIIDSKKRRYICCYEIVFRLLNYFWMTNISTIILFLHWIKVLRKIFVQFFRISLTPERIPGFLMFKNLLISYFFCNLCTVFFLVSDDKLSIGQKIWDLLSFLKVFHFIIKAKDATGSPFFHNWSFLSFWKEVFKISITKYNSICDSYLRGWLIITYGQTV